LVRARERPNKSTKPRPNAKKRVNKSQNSIEKDLSMEYKSIPTDILNIINGTKSMYKNEGIIKKKKVSKTLTDNIGNYKSSKSEHMIYLRDRSSYKSDQDLKIDNEKKQDMNLSLNNID